MKFSVSLLTIVVIATAADAFSYHHGVHGEGDRRLAESCTDVPIWYDSGGETFDCAWYASVDPYYGNADNCAAFGSDYANQGHTANSACCTCGGGVGGARAAATCPCSEQSGLWFYEGLETVTKENQIDFDLGSCVSHKGTISIEKYGKSFFVYQGGCGMANLSASGIDTANAEEVQVCFDLIEARCAEMGTPLRISESAPSPEPGYCPCWEESELENVTREDVDEEYSCHLLSVEGLMDIIAIKTIKTGERSFDVQRKDKYEETSVCRTKDGLVDIREADAQVCYSQIEAKCAAMGTPIQQ